MLAILLMSEKIFTHEMQRACGLIFKIESLITSPGAYEGNWYYLKGAGAYAYTNEMLKPVLTGEFRAFKKLLKKIKPVDYNGQERAYIGQKVDGFHVFTSRYRVAPLRFNTPAEAHQFITDNAELLEEAKNLI